MLTKLLPDPRKGVNPASAKLISEGGGIFEGKGSAWPTETKGVDRILLGPSAGSGLFTVSVGSGVRTAPPAQGASSVAQSDIHPLRVSKKRPKPPRTLVLASPNGSQAKPIRGERLV